MWYFITAFMFATALASDEDLSLLQTRAELSANLEAPNGGFVFATGFNQNCQQVCQAAGGSAAGCDKPYKDQSWYHWDDSFQPAKSQAEKEALTIFKANGFECPSYHWSGSGFVYESSQRKCYIPVPGGNVLCGHRQTNYRQMCYCEGVTGYPNIEETTTTTTTANPAWDNFVFGNVNQNCNQVCAAAGGECNGEGPYSEQTWYHNFGWTEKYEPAKSQTVKEALAIFKSKGFECPSYVWSGSGFLYETTQRKCYIPVSGAGYSCGHAQTNYRQMCYCGPEQTTTTTTTTADPDWANFVLATGFNQDCNQVCAEAGGECSGEGQYQDQSWYKWDDTKEPDKSIGAKEARAIFKSKGFECPNSYDKWSGSGFVYESKANECYWPVHNAGYRCDMRQSNYRNMCYCGPAQTTTTTTTTADPDWANFVLATGFNQDCNQVCAEAGGECSGEGQYQDQSWYKWDDTKEPDRSIGAKQARAIFKSKGFECPNSYDKWSGSGFVYESKANECYWPVHNAGYRCDMRQSNYRNMCYCGPAQTTTTTTTTAEEAAPTPAPKPSQCDNSCYSANGALNTEKQCGKDKCKSCCECTGECSTTTTTTALRCEQDCYNKDQWGNDNGVLNVDRQCGKSRCMGCPECTPTPSPTPATTTTTTGSEDNVYDKYPPFDPFKLCNDLDVKYGPSNQLMADFYYPCGDAPADGFTAIIGLHGMGGSRKNLKYLAEGFGNWGFMFVPIDWRTNGKQVGDVQLAASFIYENRAKYNVNKIYIYGYSGGGILAADVFFRESTQHIEAAVVAAGAVKKHKAMLHDKIQPVLFIGCDDDFRVAYKYAADITSSLLDMGVLAAHTLYTSSCGHYPMANMLFYHDITRFFNAPSNYYASDPVQPPAGRWEAISDTKACQVNDEGLKPGKKAKMYGLESCQGLCLATQGCVAVDFVVRSGNCNLYDEPCSTPLYEDAEGASSYKWIPYDPADGTTTTTEAPIECNKKCKKEKNKPWFKKCKERHCAACDECESL